MYKMDLLILLLPLMDHPTVQIRVNQTLKTAISFSTKGDHIVVIASQLNKLSLLGRVMYVAVIINHSSCRARNGSCEKH